MSQFICHGYIYVFLPFSIAFANAFAALFESFRNGLKVIFSVIGVSINPGHIVIVLIPYSFKIGLNESNNLLIAIFEAEYPELFCSRKGVKCLLEKVKVDCFDGHASVLLESTDFELYIAKSEFSRKRWDLKTKQEERNSRTNSFRGKRRGLGLQNKSALGLITKLS